MGDGVNVILSSHMRYIYTNDIELNVIYSVYMQIDTKFTPYILNIDYLDYLIDRRILSKI